MNERPAFCRPARASMWVLATTGRSTRVLVSNQWLSGAACSSGFPKSAGTKAPASRLGEIRPGGLLTGSPPDSCTLVAWGRSAARVRPVADILPAGGLE